MTRASKLPTLTGFDPAGEPELKRLRNGSLQLTFNFMPPSDAGDSAAEYDDFDRQLAAGIGQPVIWDDREVFIIPKPAPDAAGKVKAYVEGYRTGRHVRHIRILQAPLGDVDLPDEVRAAWVGLVIPISTIVYPQPKVFTLKSLARDGAPESTWQLEGYAVEQIPAIAVLARANAKAARWWTEHKPELMKHRRYVIFNSTCCEEVVDGR